MSSFEALQEELETLEERGLYRNCRRIDAVEGGRIRINGRWKINLASNNYLGLAQHPCVIAAAEEASRQFGVGSGSARLIGGTFPPHEALEEELARFKQAESAILFSTGYMASLGVVAALTGPEDLVIGDRLNHASLMDACRLSGTTLKVYPHKDVQRLEEALRLRRGRYRRAVVVTEGLFSMDGDIPPLPEIVQIARRYDAWVLVDDAHATGVLGASGRGSLEHFDLPAEGILQMGTLSKGLGSMGGFLAGPRVVVDLLRNRARSFIYTTALPPACAAAAREAIRVLREEPVWRDRLWSNTRRWIQGLQRIGVDLLSQESPIVPIQTGGNRETMQMAHALLEASVFAPGIRPPTVPDGTGRVRTSVTALHTEEDLDSALKVFEKSMIQLPSHPVTES